MAVAEQEDTAVAELDETNVGETPTEDSDEDGDDTVVVSIGEPPTEAEEEEKEVAPAWVKELRKTDREKTKRIRELEAQVEAKKAAENAAAELPKPTLAGCDYDEEVFESKLDAYKTQQAKAAEERRKKEEAEQAQQAAWQARLDAHAKLKGELKVPDYEEAEESVKEIFSQTQQGIMIDGADNTAVLVYALGKNPEKAKELAAITNPVKFAFAIAKLESQLKVTTRKAPPPPERRIGGSAAVVSGVDKNLEKLRAEAEKTGDHSKVMAYKRDLKAKQK